jgi:hypothetical protein
MTKIGSIGSSAATAVLPETTAPAAGEAKVPTEIAAKATVPQDPKDKVSDLKMEGQAREAQVRAQYGANPQFKMPGVDVKGPNMDDPKIQDGFKPFEKQMPPVDMKWPEKAEWKETKDKDGAILRETTDASGTQFKEKVDKNGSRERESIDKEGNRRFELIDSKGYELRGGADKNNSWSIDNKGAVTRTHTDGEGRQFMEVKNNGHKHREMMDTKGNFYKEKHDPGGMIERESGDILGNRQMEVKDQKYWMKGFADNKGNSYTVNNEGTSTRMHFDSTTGKNYAEHSFKDGTRSRQIAEKNGDTWMERIEPNGKRTVDTYKMEGNALVKQ